MDVPLHLRPYYEFCFIICFPICSHCEAEEEFHGDAPQFSDAWYLQMAAALHKAGWIIPERQMAACPACAASKALKHDPTAFE